MEYFESISLYAWPVASECLMSNPVWMNIVFQQWSMNVAACPYPATLTLPLHVVDLQP